MEDVLSQYTLPYDPLRPLICFDERPCFLIGDVGSILPMSPGKAKRYHYKYEKNGSCCVFLAFEPHTGLRYVEVRARRTAVDYAEFMQNLLAKHYTQLKEYMKRPASSPADVVPPGPAYREPPLLPQRPAGPEPLPSRR